MFSLYFPPQYSGAAKQALSLARQFRKMQHHVEFATVRWPDFAAESKVDGFVVHHLEQGQGTKHRELRLWWNLGRFLFSRRGDFDILHSHGAYYTNCIVGPLSKPFGLRSIAKASLEDDDLHAVGESVAGKIHRAFLKKIDACIATSRALETEFLSSGVSRECVFHLPNGVDTERFRPANQGEQSKLRRELSLPEKSRIALAVGVFDKRKNIGWLMDQWAASNAFGTGSLLLAIGPKAREDTNGSFLAGLHDLASRASTVLRIHEYVEDIERYYRAADFFILPSYSEGMPNVVLEAMASGLPCLATDVSGTRELVIDGKTGWIFEAGSSEALASAIKKAISSSHPDLGLQGREFIQKRYSIEAVAKKYEELYWKLLNGPN